MQKRAQTSMEFLMTYGWMILVVLAAIAALAYFGVLRLDILAPDRCTLESGITCLDFNIGTASVTLALKNNLGETITINQVTVATKDSSCSNIESRNIQNNENLILTLTGCNNGNIGDKFDGSVNITYTKESGLVHTTQGRMIATISAGEDGQGEDENGGDGGEENITCSSDIDCGISGFVGDYYCADNNITINQVNYTCLNPGTVNSSCVVLNSSVFVEYCDPALNQVCVEGNDTCLLNQTFSFEMNPGCDPDIIASGPDSVGWAFKSLANHPIHFFITKGKKFWTCSWNDWCRGYDVYGGEDIAEHWRTIYTSYQNIPICANNGSFEMNPGCDPDIIASGPDSVGFEDYFNAYPRYYITKGKKFWTCEDRGEDEWCWGADATKYGGGGEDIAEHWRTTYQPTCANNGSFEMNPGCDPDIIASGPGSVDWARQSLNYGFTYFITKGKKFWTCSRDWCWGADATQYGGGGEDISEFWRIEYNPKCVNNGSIESNPGCDPDIIASGPNSVAMENHFNVPPRYFITKGKKFWKCYDEDCFGYGDYLVEDIAEYWRTYYTPACSN